MTRRFRGRRTKWVLMPPSELSLLGECDVDAMEQPAEQPPFFSKFPSTFAQAAAFAGKAQRPPMDFANQYYRDFPSLSGAQQPQQNTSIWSNPNIRAAQHTPVQRAGNAPAASSQQQSTQSPDGPLPGSSVSPFAPGADGYRFGSQATSGQSLGQLAGLSQTQSGNSEEFPPLGGLGNGDVGSDTRREPMQNTFASNPNGGGHPSRLGLTSPLGESAERVTASAIGENRVSSAARKLKWPICCKPYVIAKELHLEMRNELTRMIERNIGRTLANPGVVQPEDSSSITYPGQSQPDVHPHPPDQVESDSPQPQRPQQKRLHEMTDKERFGLAGFLVTIDPNHPDYNPLAMGQDLTQIGLDLSRPDSSPLYPNFATPFADANSRPIVPEFSIPASYTVTNVPPLMTKIANFSDDTLFAIFYQYPRDILQELAAQEL